MEESLSGIPWSRFVALGDSLTEGVGDPVRGSLRGWADRLASSLKKLDPGLRYWNLARRSLTTRAVHETQVAPALELEPDLVSVVAGMNDVMSRDFDATVYRDDLAALVRVVAGHTTLMLGTLPRDLPLLRFMPRRTAEETRRRLGQVSDVVLDLAAQHGAVVVDAPAGWRYTMAECSVDGCHPNARGHAHIAELALVALAERAQIERPRFDYSDCAWLPSSLRHLQWLAAQGHLQISRRLFGAKKPLAPGPPA